MLALKSAGFTPVVVFDGQRPLSKMANEKRLSERLSQIEKYFAADDKGNARLVSNILRGLVVPTAAMLERLKLALDKAAIKHKTAPFEAEKQIAFDVCKVPCSTVLSLSLLTEFVFQIGLSSCCCACFVYIF